MANNKITLKLEGTVPLELYNIALGHFTALVMALTEEIVGEDTVQWTVTELSAGSAFAEITGYNDPIETVEKVVNGYGIVGTALQTGQMIPFSEKVEQEAIGITSVLNGKITAASFGDAVTAVKATVSKAVEYEHLKKLDVLDYGVIEGYVGAIADRPRLVLGIYDDMFEKRRIEILLSSEWAEQARDFWQKRIRVFGKVKRSPETGLAINVRDVTNIEIAEAKVENGFLNARGLFQWEEGDELPEVIIRRLRDGS
jgi:hypothetical protein